MFKRHNISVEFDNQPNLIPYLLLKTSKFVPKWGLFWYIPSVYIRRIEVFREMAQILAS